jgi:hypothetical protein
MALERNKERLWRCAMNRTFLSLSWVTSLLIIIMNILPHNSEGILVQLDNNCLQSGYYRLTDLSSQFVTVFLYWIFIYLRTLCQLIWFYGAENYCYLWIINWKQRGWRQSSILSWHHSIYLKLLKNVTKNLVRIVCLRVSFRTRTPAHTKYY